MERYFGESTPKLGFGLMRLPKRAMVKIDIEQTKQRHQSLPNPFHTNSHIY